MQVSELVLEPVRANAPFSRDSLKSNRWAVILAGGEGVRLRPLSRLISGDDRPKQFCPLFGGRSLLAHTRSRIAPMFSRDKTLFVVTKAHEAYYREELQDVDPERILVQPFNKGTGMAIAFALTRIFREDPDAVVTFFPSDHYYSDEKCFRAAAEITSEIAAARPDCLLLLGAEPTHAETGYGWIEMSSTPGPQPYVRRVTRFREKPSFETAQVLLRQGCVWNTFVMAGSVGAFMRLMHSAAPVVLQLFAAAARCGDLAAAYHPELAPLDFSHDVLSSGLANLYVYRMPVEVGWSDLGEPERVMAALSVAGEELWPARLSAARRAETAAAMPPVSVSAVA